MLNIDEIIEKADMRIMSVEIENNVVPFLYVNFDAIIDEDKVDFDCYDADDFWDGFGYESVILPYAKEINYKYLDEMTMRLVSKWDYDNAMFDEDIMDVFIEELNYKMEELNNMSYKYGISDSEIIDRIGFENLRDAINNKFFIRYIDIIK